MADEILTEEETQEEAPEIQEETPDVDEKNSNTEVADEKNSGVEYPEELVRWASEHNVDPTKYSSASELTSILSALDSRRPKETPVEPKPQEKSEAQLFLEEIEKNPELFDDNQKRLAEFVVKQEQHARQLEEKLGRAEQAAKERESRLIIANFDNTLDNMGEEITSLVGASKTLNAEQKSVRSEIWDTYCALYNSAESKGKTINEEALIKKATKAVLSDDIEKMTRRKIASESKTRTKTQPANVNKTSPVADDEDSIKKHIASFVKEKGGDDEIKIF